MILLGLGSNLSSRFGNRFENIDLALTNLQNNGIKLLKKSSFYESLAFPNKNDPKFINIVVDVSTELDASNLASVLILVEEILERKRGRKNDPRTCDIDIIDFKGQIKDFKYQNLDFTVPHKNIVNRNFVLFPLFEIAPNWIHPKTKQSINSLINNLSNEDKNSILKIEKS